MEKLKERDIKRRRILHESRLRELKKSEKPFAGMLQRESERQERQENVHNSLNTTTIEEVAAKPFTAQPAPPSHNKTLQEIELLEV